MKNKEILFISTFDFVEMGLQVVSKTPVYFAEHGWTVHCLILRDKSKGGSYYYEREINPAGVRVYRSEMPKLELGEKLTPGFLKTCYSKFRGYATIFKFIVLGYSLLKKNPGVDVIYGCGPAGALAAGALRILFFRRSMFTVSRFYGVFNGPSIIRSRLRRLFNWDVVLALYLRFHLCIVTNDGTQGDLVLKALNSRSLPRLKFWSNGVDYLQPVEDSSISKIKDRLHLKDEFLIVSVCRLISWKRVDRTLQSLHVLVHKLKFKDVKFLIVGEGPERGNLEKLCRELKLQDNVVFVGGVPHGEVAEYLALADAIVSMFDLSNVGNPLLEAIRANQIIFTLDNGDTSRWIQNRQNGFIYKIDETLHVKMARDILSVATDESLREKIQAGIREVEHRLLWTWDERLAMELDAVNEMISTKLK